jgi:hypothetical protein
MSILQPMAVLTCISLSSILNATWNENASFKIACWYILVSAFGLIYNMRSY